MEFWPEKDRHGRGQKGKMVGEKDQFEKLVKIGQNGKKHYQIKMVIFEKIKNLRKNFLTK